MHGDVDAAVEQRLFELFHEHASLTDLAERARAIAVACGRDRYERKLDTRGAQPCGGGLGLGQREPTAAGPDANQHGTTRVAAASARRTTGGDGCERTPSAPAPEGVARSDPQSSALVLETEQVAHRVSINH